MPRRALTATASAALVLLGGVLLVIAPFVSWASVRPDGAAFAATLRETRAQVREGLLETTLAYSWLERDGRAGIALSAGIVVVVVGIVSLRQPRRGAALVGLVGATLAFALAIAGRPDADVLVDAAVRDAAKWAVAVGVDPHALRPVFIVESGRSVGLVVVGAALAAIGAIATAALSKDEGDPDWIP